MRRVEIFRKVRNYIQNGPRYCMTARGVSPRSKPTDGLRSTDIVLRGRDRILQLRTVLTKFCTACGQDGRMDDLHYFFSKPGILQSEPVLFLLLRKEVQHIEKIDADSIFGAALLYEYRLFGFPLKAMAVADRAGGALIGLPEDRPRIAARMRDVLTKMGVHIAILSVDATGQAGPGAQICRDAALSAKHEWTFRHRHYAAYLQLAPSLDATLAGIHQKTRFNLRYYRRRAEKDLGSYFLPEASLNVEEFIAFNKVSSHPVEEAVLRWRLQGQKLLNDPVLVGVKDGTGAWLSILAARRNGNRSEILWQMNRSGLPQHSIGTVMRSYFIENEILHGMRRLYVEQGTPHMMKNSFVYRDLYDLVLVRRSLRRFFEFVARKRLQTDNPLAELLLDDSARWRGSEGTQHDAVAQMTERRRTLIEC